MLLKSNIIDIKNIVKGDNVLSAKEECYAYSFDSTNIKDCSSVPDVVVFVETVDDVVNIVKYASLHNIPIVSRGAGTNMVGACTCPKGGIVLNFSKMDKVLDINTTNLTVTVQPGVILGDLKDKLTKLGFMYPPDPSNYKVSTVGGSIAQSSGGAKSLKYGTTKDYVLSLKVVTADGKVVDLGAKTHKDSVGYHLNQLIVGSEGTLAIIVEAVLKIVPKPETSGVIAAYFEDIQNAVNAVNKINLSNIQPSAVEYMDKNSIKTVEDFINIGLKTDFAGMLLIEIDGSYSAIAESSELIQTILEECNCKDIIISKDEVESEKIWRARRISYAATARLAPDVISDDIIVPRQNLSQMLTVCKNLSEKYGLTMCLVGHIGDGNIHPQIALDLNDEEVYESYCKFKSEMYEAVLTLGGTISAEHGVGLEKKAYINKVVDNEAIEYMRKIKNIFDPKNIFNPGKIF